PAPWARAPSADHRGRRTGRAGGRRGRRAPASGRPVARGRSHMLPAAMRRRAALYLAFAAALLLLGVAVAGCGEEASSEAVEGEPLELGGLKYNVQITRFLNPDDTEDQEYLVGQPPLKPGNAYLGVFMVIENDTDDERTSASDFTVVDTLDTEYKP